MQTLTREELEEALRTLGIANGDLILVHSDLMTLGIPEGIESRNEILKFYLDVFRDVLGPEGTLSVPAYFYEYARYGIPFDTKTSPVSKSLGAFSAYIAALPDAVRSCNPIQSIASTGFKAREISGGLSLNGYGVTSPWHRLRKKGCKMIFLGVDMQSMTFVHYIEQLVGVPHLYFKVFDSPVTKDEAVVSGSPVSAVRYLNFGIEYDLKPFQELLFKRKLARSVKVGRGEILIVTAEDAYRTGVECLEKEMYFFLKQPPKFIGGQIPRDGPAVKK